MKREIKEFTLGPVNTKCYVLKNTETMECLVFDPGANTDVFVNSFKVDNYTIKGIFLTHGHFDHIGGVSALVETYDATVYAVEDEAELLCQPSLNLSSKFGREISVKEFCGLNDGDELELAGFKVKIITTPGHTSGGGCYYIAEEGIIFTGDTLFSGCIGRTDFPTGNTSTLVRSIREKLFILPDETIVYPGHMEATTIGHEKKHNPLV